MGLLNGKKVLITGARKGIGRGIAITLANEGADVGVNDIVNDEFSKKLLEIISSKRVKATFHEGDVSKIEEIKRLRGEGLAILKICKRVGVSANTVYSTLRV